MARNRKSIGEMISTVTFLGVCLACIAQALAFIEATLFLRAGLSFFAAFLCFMGGIRFMIADGIKAFNKWRHK